MIDIETEHLLSPAEATRHVALRSAEGRPCHLSKFYRLAMAGIRGVKLETVRLPRGLVTSREAIGRFVERLQAPEAPQSPVKPDAQAMHRRAMMVLAAAGIGREHQNASRELEAAGW